MIILVCYHSFFGTDFVLRLKEFTLFVFSKAKLYTNFSVIEFTRKLVFEYYIDLRVG